MKIDPLIRVHIKEVKLYVLIGTRPEERLLPQELMADITFEYDGSLAAQTDVLAHAVDYAAVHALILERISTTKFLLLERLAAFILSVIMEDVRIMQATLLLEKKAVLPGAKSVGVGITAKRSGMGKINTLRCY